MLAARASARMLFPFGRRRRLGLHAVRSRGDREPLTGGVTLSRTAEQYTIVLAGAVKVIIRADQAPLRRT